MPPSAATIARQLGDTHNELDALPAVALAALDDGDLELTRRHGRRLVDLADAVDDRSARLRGLAVLGIAEGELGDRSVGTRLLLEAARAARANNDPSNEGIQLTYLAELELRHDPARDEGDLATALVQLGTTFSQVDRLSEARPVLIEAGALAVSIDTDDLVAAMLMAGIPYLRRTGDPDLAARLWGAVQRLRRANGTHLRANDDAIVQRELMAALTSMSAQQVDHEVRVGREGDPRALLRELVAHLKSRRSRVDRSLTSPDSALTPREAEVFRLLGDGMGDRAIAEHLAISTRTASVHVSNVKSKLGMSTRLQVVIAARALDDAGDSRRHG